MKVFWNRENKINISIDKIVDTVVYGHSVVAGNDRKFEGSVSINNRAEDTVYSFVVREPGDDKYDGEFQFVIKNKELKSTWTAFGDVDVKKRHYNLSRKRFIYNPYIALEQANEYIDWNKSIANKEVYEEDGEEVEEWVSHEFATAITLIYELNASAQLLTSEDLENLRKGDLRIIRNTIYARHGYSFKNRPLRVFFDAQSWYIPVHTDVKNDITKIEQKNIELVFALRKKCRRILRLFW